MDNGQFVISTKPVESLVTFNETVKEIKFSIQGLREYIKTADLNDPKVKQIIRQNIAHLKLFYGQAERISLNVDG